MTVSGADWFFAYSSSPHLRAETVRDAASGVSRGGTSAMTWEDLTIKGKVLIEEITSAIDASRVVFAEVSDLNPNVLFEAGYALARNKHLWLGLDETDTEAIRNWKDLGILATVGRVNYSGNTDVLIGQCLEDQPVDADEASLLEVLLAGGKSRQADAVFAPAMPARIQAAVLLESMLERRTNLTVLGAGDDLGMAPWTST